MKDLEVWVAEAGGTKVVFRLTRERVGGRMSAPMSAFEVRMAAAVILKVDPLRVSLTRPSIGDDVPGIRVLTLRHVGDPMHTMGRDKLRLEWREGVGPWERIH